MVADEEYNEEFKGDLLVVAVLIATGVMERKTDRTSACLCLLLLVASAACCCCMLLLQHAAAAAAAAANVCFPNKNPLFCLFFVSDYAHSGKSSAMTIFPTEVLVSIKK